MSLYRAGWPRRVLSLHALAEEVQVVCRWASVCGGDG
jgi:hypothetical protein